MQLDDLLQFALAHQAALGGSAGALLASTLHARLDASPRAQRALAWLLPPFLNSKLAKAVAVDVARAVIAAWDIPPAAPAPKAADTAVIGVALGPVQAGQPVAIAPAQPWPPTR